MTTTNRPYPSTMCLASFVKDETDEAIADGYKVPPFELCGYTLIDGHLVPETFIQQVIDQLDGEVVEFGPVLNRTHIFTDAFLHSLSETDDAVLMGVVLQLVARGQVPLNLSSACLDEECEEEAD